MNNITPEQKQPVLKALALAGLVVVIIFIAWLAVLIVQILPSALSSLASTASSVYNHNPLQTTEFKLQKSETLINVNQPFAVSWNHPFENGSYTFSYNCTDEVTLDLRINGKEFSDLKCNQSYDLGKADALTMTVNTNKERFTDISYTINLYKPNNPTPVTSTTATTTVVNTNIVEITENGNSTTTPATSTPAINEKPTETVTATSSTATTSTNVVVKPKPVKPTPSPKPVVTPTYTYAIPSSNPYGTPDLVVSYIGVGTVSKSGVFSKTGTIKGNVENNALQFSVHNVGNKTSDNWSYLANLPGNARYQSGTEKPLLPNERAVITIPFNKITKSYYETFSVVVDTKTDANKNTNSFVNGTIVVY